jgi:hypothetical protein
MPLITSLASTGTATGRPAIGSLTMTAAITQLLPYPAFARPGAEQARCISRRVPEARPDLSHEEFSAVPAPAISLAGFPRACSLCPLLMTPLALVVGSISLSRSITYAASDLRDSAASY